MAVSGRKETDMLGSIAYGSAEVFENECEPCLTMGQHKDVHGFCVSCQEYLCKTCRDCHKKTKASRNHQVLERDEFDKIHTKRKSKVECTELCLLHKKEIIKFYCPKHANLGCNDCMTIGHRTCDIYYIPEKCEGIADGKEYKDITVKLTEKLKEAEEVCKTAESSRSDINDINKEVINKIEEFRADINDRLDQIQQSILNNVDRKSSIYIETVQKVIDTCGNIISDVKKLQSSIRDNKSKNEIGQLYIDIRRAEAALKSKEVTEAKEKLMNMNIQYTFRRSVDLEKLLSKEIVFGELIDHAQPESTKKKTTIDQVNVKNDINVNTISDEIRSNATRCDVQPHYNNDKVKVLSTGSEDNEIDLNESTWGTWFKKKPGKSPMKSFEKIKQTKERRPQRENEKKHKELMKIKKKDSKAAGQSERSISLSDCTMSPNNPSVPHFIEKCVEFIESKGLHIEGIYRIHGNKAHVELLTTKYNEDSNIDISSLDIQVNAVATALKAFFADLSEPLVPMSFYDELIEASGVVDKNRRIIALRGVFFKMHPLNFEVLKFLVTHLHEVSKYCDQNSMDSKNLSLCWWPTLFRTELDSFEKITKFSRMSDILQTLIEQCSYFFYSGNEI